MAASSCQWPSCFLLKEKKLWICTLFVCCWMATCQFFVLFTQRLGKDSRRKKTIRRKFPIPGPVRMGSGRWWSSCIQTSCAHLNFHSLTYIFTTEDISGKCTAFISISLNMNQSIVYWLEKNKLLFLFKCQHNS